MNRSLHQGRAVGVAWIVALLTGLVAVTAVAGPAEAAPAQQGDVPAATGAVIPEELFEQAAAGGSVEVIVQTTSVAGGPTLSAQMDSVGARTIRQYDQLPMVALEVDTAALEALAQTPGVVSVQPNRMLVADLASTVPLIGASTAHADGITGTGATVAILDTGIDADHPFVASRIVAPACFSGSSSGSASLCPNGQTTDLTSADIEPGSTLLANCAGLEDICDHGTHVAGIAAGAAAGDANAPGNGVAPGANIMPVQVFSRYSAASCGGQPCMAAADADLIAGLNYVLGKEAAHNVAAVNMSLGGGRYYSACDTDALKPAIDSLLAANVATVTSAGNRGYPDSVGSPGCISSAVTVGATTDSDSFWTDSNRGPLLDLFAPGTAVTSSIRNGYTSWNGTSMAAPHVAGAFALARQANPSLSVTEQLADFKARGVPITYTAGSAGTVTTPRLNALAALLHNDAFADAVNVSPIPFSAIADTTGATTQAGEPAPSCQTSYGHSVWYRVVRTVPARMRVSTTGSSYDTVVAVYEGTALGSLTPVACNDDIGGGSLASSVEFQAQPWRHYYVQVAGYSANAGRLSMQASILPPMNDMFVAATNIGAVPFSETIETSTATVQPGEPAPSCRTTFGHSVWYRFVTPYGARISVHTKNSFYGRFDTILAVYEGTSLGSLTPVACNDDVGGSGDAALLSYLEFQAQPNKTYYIQAAGYGTAAGGLNTAVAMIPSGNPRADFDGDGDSDVSVFRPSSSSWFVQGGLATGWGVAGDVPLTGDFNGDGVSDVAVFRPSAQTWYVKPSASFPGGLSTQWGIPGDIPVPADYNGDGADEVAVYRPSDQTWYSKAGLATQWGKPGDIPIPVDFNGDGADEVAVYRPSDQTWYSKAGLATQWGKPGDIPVPADYNGDGADEVAVYRPSDRTWYSKAGLATQWGITGDRAVPGDYNGDGIDEVAVFRPSNQTWYSKGGLATQWGATGDIPVIIPPAIRGLY